MNLQIKTFIIPYLPLHVTVSTIYVLIGRKKKNHPNKTICCFLNVTFGKVTSSPPRGSSVSRNAGRFNDTVNYVTQTSGVSNQS